MAPLFGYLLRLTNPSVPRIGRLQVCTVKKDLPRRQFRPRLMISCHTPAERKGVGARRPDAVRRRQSAWAVVEPIPVGIEPQDDTATREREANEERDVEAKVEDSPLNWCACSRKARNRRCSQLTARGMINHPKARSRSTEFA